MIIIKNKLENLNFREKKDYICNIGKQLKITITMETTIFIQFEIEFVNETTGQVVSLTTACGSYKELGKYLTDMAKKQWRMLKVTRKGH